MKSTTSRSRLVNSQKLSIDRCLLLPSIELHKYMGYSTYKHSVFGITLSGLFNAHYKPVYFVYFSLCGTKFYMVFKLSTRGKRRDIGLKGVAIEMRGSRGLEVHRSSSTHVAILRSYNGSDETRRGRISTIRSRFEGRAFRLLYNTSQLLHPDAPSKIRQMQHNQNGPRWTISL